MTNDRCGNLIEAWLNATLDDAEFAELEGLLLESTEARRDFWQRAAIHGWLSEAAKILHARPVADDTAPAPPTPAPALAPGRAPQPLLQRGILLGAAVALIGGCGIGSVATSMALAYSGLLSRAIAPVMLHEEGFEHPPAPEQNYLPTEFNVWGGDETAVVSAERGVKPRTGRKMLRFVTSHPRGVTYEGNASEIWRVLDLDELRRLGGAHELHVEIAGFFNGAVPAGVQRTSCLIGAIATDMQPASLGERWRTLFDAAEAASTRTAIGQRSSVIDDDPATWQRLSASVTVPAEARYLVLYCLASMRPTARAHVGAAEFIDDITVVVTPVGPRADTEATRRGGIR